MKKEKESKGCPVLFLVDLHNGMAELQELIINTHKESKEKWDILFEEHKKKIDPEWHDDPELYVKETKRMHKKTKMIGGLLGWYLRKMAFEYCGCTVCTLLIDFNQ